MADWYSFWLGLLVGMALSGMILVFPMALSLTVKLFKELREIKAQGKKEEDEG